MSLLDFSDTASVKRPGDLRIDLERGIVVGDRVIELPKLQIDGATGVESVKVVRPKLQ